jgi:hypothetical protein
MVGSIKCNVRIESFDLRPNEAETQAFREAAEIAGLLLSAWIRVTSTCKRNRTQCERRQIPLLSAFNGVIQCPI